MDATQWAGLAAFGSAAIGSLFLRPPTGPTLAAINACFAAECALGLRHHLHDRAVALLGGYYPERQPFQITLILLAGLAALLMLARGLRFKLPAAAGIPALATGAALFLFGIETISLHAVDRLLYRPAGPFLIIGWMWIALGAATTIGATRRRRPPRSSG